MFEFSLGDTITGDFLFFATICVCQAYYNGLPIIIDVNLFKSSFKKRRGKRDAVGF